MFTVEHAIHGHLAISRNFNALTDGVCRVSTGSTNKVLRPRSEYSADGPEPGLHYYRHPVLAIVVVSRAI